MLLLDRKVGEAIVIGDYDVSIRILSISENAIKLAIGADDDIAIHREEVYRKLVSKGGVSSFAKKHIV